MKYDEYIAEFNNYSKQYDMSFIRYKHNETEDEKEDIILFFSKYFPHYKFYNSVECTAFFFKLKEE